MILSLFETDHSLDKRALRRTLRSRRQALSIYSQRRAAQRLAQRIQQLPWFIRADSIAFYLAADGEIDPLPLLELALLSGKRTFLPSLRGKHLVFIEYRAGQPMRPNRFGILEPYESVPVGLNQLDVVCMPLVGFDRSGGRLGMGGGFYDRTFARRRTKQPVLIGLAHSLQECTALPREPWDIPLGDVVTEREWIRMRG